MKNILALDGGGIRGVFTLEILARMEQMLRKHYGRDDLVLRDHFDFFAGTSTGAIIAACLCWGYSVEQILDLYVSYGRKMFQPIPWYNPRRFLVSRFDAKPLSDMLMRIFSEDGDGKVPALLGSDKLRATDGQLRLLMVVVRNHSTGSAWPLTNNPKAKYNNREHKECNLDIPLYKLVRASTAAPVYFDPEVIHLGSTKSVFVDGSITPYNNPALIAALTVVLPSYNLTWETGPDKIRMISIGTIRFPSGLPKKAGSLWVGYNAARIPAALIQGAASEQDYLCRCLGDCIYGEPIDSEVKNLVGVPLPGQRWFSYVRYNRSYGAAEVEELLLKHPSLAQLDAVRAIPILREIGKQYADNVLLSHLVGDLTAPSVSGTR
jgi:patatin-like phospholipase/acyl hydrolase